MHDFVVIPALNPDQRLISLVKELSRDDRLEIVVVDDGSDAPCLGIFQAILPFAAVLTHKENRGKGAAIRTALLHIMKQGQPGAAVVIADGDGQHLPVDIRRILSVARQKRDGIILGTREFSRDTPLKSRLGNWITSIVIFLLTGKYLKDTQTGLRAFDISLIPFLLEIPGERYEYETNMILEAIRARIGLVEVPVRAVYLDGNKSSHFLAVRDSVHIYWNIIKFFSSSLVCFGIDYSIFAAVNACLGLLPVNLSGRIAISNIAARAVSSVCNFHINWRYVFGSKGDLAKAALGYFTLAAGIFCANTLLLFALASIFKMEILLAKLITECLLFLVSFLVQRFLIFGKKTKEPARIK